MVCMAAFCRHYDHSPILGDENDRNDGANHYCNGDYRVSRGTSVEYASANL